MGASIYARSKSVPPLVGLNYGYWKWALASATDVARKKGAIAKDDAFFLPDARGRYPLGSDNAFFDAARAKALATALGGVIADVKARVEAGRRVRWVPAGWEADWLGTTRKVKTFATRSGGFHVR